jgi:multidrug efflux pump subunit AcrA (membrane-fusion protein)
MTTSRLIASTNICSRRAVTRSPTMGALGLAALAVFASVMLAGCGGSQSAEEVTATTPVPVTTQPAVRGTVEAITTATGIITAAPGAELIVVAPQAGRIARLPKGEGDAVRKGDLLVEFDIPSSQAEVAAREAEVTQARARIANARNALTRLQGLFERGVAARKEVEDAQREAADAEAVLANSEAARTAARQVASRTTVVAPFAGVIARRFHNPGDSVDAAAADPVLRVVDPARAEVAVAVPAGAANRIRPGQAARIRSALDDDGGAGASASGSGSGDASGTGGAGGGAAREAPGAAAGTKADDKAHDKAEDKADDKADDKASEKASEKADDAAGSRFWPASVLTRPTVVDPATATANVRLTLRPKAVASRSAQTAAPPPIGTAVRADIVTDVRTGVITIPANAIVRDGGQTFAFIVGSDNKAHRHEVKLGVVSETTAEIVSGVSLGDNVIVRGHEALPDGATVRPEDSADESAPAKDGKDGKDANEGAKGEASDKAGKDTPAKDAAPKASAKDGKSPK